MPSSPSSRPLSADLIRAYWQTRYCVFPPGQTPWILRAGLCQSAFDLWLAETLGQSCWCVITAWNPSSEQREPALNGAANAALTAQIEAAGYLWLPAQGEPEAGDWPPEASLWVAGLGAEDACDWGRQYGQNAVLWGRLGEAAQLLACATGAVLPFPAEPNADAPLAHSPPHLP